MIFHQEDRELKRRSITTIALLSMTLFAAVSCAQKPIRGDVPYEPGEDFGLFVAGKRIDVQDGKGLDPELRNELLSAIEPLADAFGLENFKSEEARKRVGDRIGDIESGKARRLEDVPAPLTGLAGCSVIQALKIIVLGDPNAAKPGKIVDWEFHYDAESVSRGSGHLTVDMPCVFDGASGTLRWEVKVNDRGYKIVQRVNAARRNPQLDPFPGTMQLPEAALDENDAESIWVRNLTYKTYAAGTTIEVLNVHRVADGGVVSRLSESDYPALYASTASSCVDMLTDGEPPHDETGLPEQTGYCLGRCAHPFVINSR